MSLHLKICLHFLVLFLFSSCGLDITIKPKINPGATVTFGFHSFSVLNSSPTNSTTFNLSYGTLVGEYHSYCLQENDPDENNCTWILGTVPATFLVSVTENAKVLSLWVKNDTKTSSRFDSNSVLLDTSVLPPTGMTVVLPLTNPGTLTTPTLRVTGIEVGSTVEVYEDSNCIIGSFLGSAIGVASADVTTLALGNGPHPLYATQTDLAGNVSACSALLETYTVGSAGVLSLSSSNDFEGVVKGLNKEMEFSLMNSGDVDATSLSISAASSGVFSFTSGSYPGAIVAQSCGTILTGGNSTCVVKLTFTPSAIGVVTGSFDLDYFDGSTTQTLTIDLTGYGGKIDFSLPDWDFGSEGVGRTSYTNFILTNPETVALEIAPVLTGSNFQFPGGYPGSGGIDNNTGENTCGGSLPPGDSCLLTLGFTPGSIGVETGSISIGDYSTALSGTGVMIPGNFCTCLGAPGNFGGGNGSAGDPYQICNKPDLEKLHTDFVASSAWVNQHFIQCADINLGGSGTPWTPIGDGSSLGFLGSYNGNFYAIDNLYFNNSVTDDIGLFKGLSSATIKNIALTNISVEARVNVGGIAGICSGSLISNSYVSGDITGSRNTGGLCGSFTGSTSEINYSFFKGNIQGTGQLSGGIIGNAMGGTLSNVFSLGSAENSLNMVGGIAGAINGISSRNLFSRMDITVPAVGGGIFGNALNSQVLSAQFIGSVTTSTGDFAGGIIGNADNVHLSHSHSSGRIQTSRNNAGGLIGNMYRSNLSDSYSTGRVSCDSYCGGLVGLSGYSTIQNSYATGNINAANDYAGGLVGSHSIYIKDSYSTGEVSGRRYVGGLIGFAALSDNYRNYSASLKVTASTLDSGPFVGNDNPAAFYINNFFWGTGTLNSGTPNLPADPETDNVTIKSASEMQTESTFTSWDFDYIWAMNPAGNKFPYLLQQGPGIFSFSPSSGLAGTTVIIKGLHFTGATLVGLHQQGLSNFTINSDTQITAELTGAAGSYKIVISTPYGDATSGQTFTIDAINPVVTSFSVASATIDDTITLTGTGFSLVNDIKINGTAVSEFTVNSDTSITLTIPVGASTGSFVLTTSDRGSGTSASFPITYPPLFISLKDWDFGETTNNRQNYLLVRIKNLSGSALSISGSFSVGTSYYFPGGYPGVGGPDVTPAAGVSACGASLAAGASCELIIVYHPLVVTGTEDIDRLKVVTPLGTRAVNLTGLAVDPVSDCACLSIVPGFGGGDGSAGNPYQVCNRDDLELLHLNIDTQSGWRDTHFIQCADINLNGSSAPFTPIGLDASSQFEGSYDGNYYLIGNFYFNDPLKNYIGLFSKATDATFKNIYLYNINLTGNFFVGGVVAEASNSVLKNIFTTGSIIADKHAGGIASMMSGTQLNYSFSHVAINSGLYDGGIASTVSAASSFNYVFTTQNQAGSNVIGGAIGELSSSTVANSFSLGNVSGSNAGGFVGNASSNSVITNSYSTGDVSGWSTAGGFAYSIQGNASVSSSYASGNVTGSSNIGGFVGFISSGELENVYATGSVSAGVDNAGGLIGITGSASTVTFSYAANSSITSNGYGGLISGDAVLVLGGTQNYVWDQTVLTVISNQANGVDPSFSTTLNTVSMQDASSFVGFDFAAIWKMGQTGNYFPVLRGTN